MDRTLLAACLLSAGINAFPCTCVTAGSTVKELMASDAVVFRGAVLERKTLPSHPEMRGRSRYAITFRVHEYWKGSPGRTVVIYGLDPAPDCLSGGEYEAGKEYLVFAHENPAKDVRLGDSFWYGWNDVLPEGTPMLFPSACKPGGEVTKVRGTLQELGPGRVPAPASRQ